MTAEIDSCVESPLQHVIASKEQVSSGHFLICGAEPPSIDDEPYRIAFFDLDNTLIPTSWIMQYWRSDDFNHLATIQAINGNLVQAGVFEALDDLFSEVKKHVDDIWIITNAGSKTVEHFYLKLCMPELRSILAKHKVDLFSTERWVTELGPPPTCEDEVAFREFYTIVKYKEFETCITGCQAITPPAGDRRIEIVSIGDQMCEISAACRLGDNIPNIDLLRLVLILDRTNSRFSQQVPKLFAEQLIQLKDQTLRTLAATNTSIMSTQIRAKIKAFDTGFEARPNVSYWVPQPCSMAYAIGRPGHFPAEFPYYLPVDYFNLKMERSAHRVGVDSNELEQFLLANLILGPRNCELPPSLSKLDPNSVMGNAEEDITDEDDDYENIYTLRKASTVQLISQLDTTTTGFSDDCYA